MTLIFGANAKSSEKVSTIIFGILDKTFTAFALTKPIMVALNILIVVLVEMKGGGGMLRTQYMSTVFL